MTEKLKLSAIEGNCFSGKSTILKELRQKYDVKVIGEYADFANDGKDFPPFPPKSYEDAKKSIDFFVGIEKKRFEKAINIASKTNLPVVMDRSPFSCMVFQAAVESQFDHPSAYAYSIDAFNKEAQDGSIIYPQTIVYLEPENIDVFKKRVFSRGRVAIDFLNTPDNFLIMQRIYNEFISKHYSDKNSLLLKSLEGNIDLVAFTAFEFITNAFYKPLTKIEHLDISSIIFKNK